MINSIPENRLVSEEVRFSSKEIPENILQNYSFLSGGTLIDIDQTDFNFLNSVLASMLLYDSYFKELNYLDIVTDLFDIHQRSLHDLKNEEWTILLRTYLSSFNIKDTSFAIILSDDNIMFYMSETSKNHKENIFIIVKDKEKYNSIYFNDSSYRGIIFDELISRL